MASQALLMPLALATVMQFAAVCQVRAQGGATMIGGRPPKAVVLEQCNVRTRHSSSPTVRAASQDGTAAVPSCEGSDQACVSS